MPERLGRVRIDSVRAGRFADTVADSEPDASSLPSGMCDGFCAAAASFAFQSAPIVDGR